MTTPTNRPPKPPWDSSPENNLTAVGAPRCKAMNRSGGRCKKPALKGQEVCDYHGGNTPQARAAAQRRLEAREAEKAVERFAVKVPNVTPSEALLEELQWTVGNVAYFRSKVQDLDEQSLVMGVSKVVQDTRGRSSTAEAKPSVWYEMWMRERDHLVKVAAACVKAGVDQRRIELAEQEGLLVAGVVGRILDSMFAALMERGVDTAQHWDDLTRTIVPREFRAIDSARPQEVVV